MRDKLFLVPTLCVGTILPALRANIMTYDEKPL